MVWIPILLLGLFAMLTAVLALRLPRHSWMLFASVLMFGLAGYGLHGSPGQSSAPKEMTFEEAQSGEGLVAARRALFDTGQQPPNYLVTSDAFARQGRFGDAAGLLRRAVSENPDDAEAWLALANALVEHAKGQVTPPALYAYEQAQQAFPAHPGAGYFLGMSYLRSGEPEEARRVWSELLERSPEDAPWRADLAFRVARLDEMIAQMQGMRQLMEAPGGPPPSIQQQMEP